MIDQTRVVAEFRPHFLDYWRVIKTRKIIVFIVFLLAVIVAGTVSFFQPRIYTAAARIKVEPDRPTVAVYEAPSFAGYDPYFLQTQYEIIQSKQTLYPVIEKRELQKRWGGKGGDVLPLDVAFRRLKANLAVRRYRDTSLIEIAVFDEDPKLAADLANTVADIFEKQRLERKKEQTLKGITKLREELDQRQQAVRAAQEKVDQLRKQLNVPLFGSGLSYSKLTDQTLQQLEGQLTIAKVEAVSREVKLQELKKLPPPQLRNTIATIINDPNVQQLHQDLTKAEFQLEILKEDYGPEHPIVLTAISGRGKLAEQLDSRLEGVMRGFEVDTQVAAARVNELQKQVDDAKAASLLLENAKFVPFINAQRDAEMATRFYESLKQRIDQTTIEMEIPRSPIEFIDRAEPSLNYVRPNVSRSVSLGAVVGLVLGVALAFFIEFLDTSVKRVEDVERFLGLPVLGVVAQRAGLLSRGEADMAHVEAYRMLRTNIEFAKEGGALRSLCVLSAGAGEGKSMTLANLAVVYAQHGARVLVVDSDLRRPGVHKYLDVSNDIGLAEYLASTKSVDEIIKPTSTPNVSIITSGGGSAGTKGALPMLTSQRMQQLIQDLAQRFDMVLYDTPPILGVSDAAITAREVGAAILVIQHRRYPRTMSLRAKQVLENAGGKLLGVVVNNVHLGQDETYYYYQDQVEHYERSTEPASPGKSKGKTDEIKLGGKY